jgi:altronate dehydratase small subunit
MASCCGTPIAPTIKAATTTALFEKRIPFGHKFATRDIGKGTLVVKYGEPMGVATRDIKAGSHVHVHNVESSRGRGDR